MRLDLETRAIRIGEINIGGAQPIALISGPCQLESRAHARMICEGLLEACAPTGTQLIFRASNDKANRSSLGAERGPGMEAGLRILSDIRTEYGVPVLTDVHEPWHCAEAARAVDISGSRHSCAGRLTFCSPRERQDGR